MNKDGSYYLGANQEERKIFRDWLTGVLRERPVTVTFKKKDGTDRVLSCTLKSELVKTYEKKTDREKKVNEEVCSVFDLEKQEWRSFKYESIINIKFEL